MAKVVSAKGYPATWVNDIVAEAKASKSTFYKNFEGRADCMLRGYDLVISFLTANIYRVLPTDGDPVSRFNAGITELLRLMAAMPEFTRCFLLEFPSVGAVANDRKHAVVESIGQAIVRWDRETAARHPEFPEISEVHAIGLTAAIYELLFWKARRDGVERLAEIGPEISSLHNLIYAEIRSK